MSNFKYFINGNTYEVAITDFEDNFATVTVNGVTYEVEIAREKKARTKVERPKVVAGAGPQPARTRPGLSTVSAPLPGVIKEIACSEGMEVKKGQRLCVLEAMKMENELSAPADGKVGRVYVTAGQSVLEGDTILTIGAS